jgi:outer membrane receptor protein involved in Fe transport
MRKYQIIICSLFIIFNSLHSQTNKDSFKNISGKVIDSLAKLPLEFSQVSLYKSSDTSLVNKVYSDEKGDFRFDKLYNDTYFLQIKYLGFYSKTLTNLTIDESVLNIDLKYIYLISEPARQMETVQITAKQDVLQNGIDKKIFNVSKDLSSKGAAATDVLNNIPSVDVDQDGAVSLRGDANVTVLIDGRLSSISGSNGKSLLESIPASSIERIEVVTNPSSKYSPDGTSGIINIVLKKNKSRGTNYLFSSSFANGPLFNGSANFSFRNEKMNFFANYSYRYSDGYRNYSGDMIRKYDNDSTSTLSQNREGKDLKKGNTIRLGADFYLKSNQTLGFVLTGSDNQHVRTGDLQNSIYSTNSLLQNLWTRSSTDPNNTQSYDLAGYYKIDLKDNKGSLNVDLNFSKGIDNFEGVYQEIYYDIDGSLGSKSNLNQTVNNKENNSNGTIQIDYTKNLKKNMRFESGVKTILRDLSVNSYSKEQDTISNEFVLNQLSNFDYSYKEQVYAVYSTLGQVIGKFKYQAGLRAEQAYQLPYLISQDLKYTNDYFKVYPSAHIKFNPKNKQEWSLSYSKRINRPTPGQLNPFSNYSDPFNLRKGNPALKPEFIDSYDLGYAFEKDKFSLTSSIYYRHTVDVIQRLREYYSDNTSAVVFSNINESNSLGFELVLSYKPFKWYRNTFSINGNTINYKDPTIEITTTQNGFNWGAKYMGAVDFWKKTMSVQVNVNYFAPRFVPQGIVQRRGGVDITTEKTFNEFWSVGFKITDVFDQQGFTLDISQSNIDQTAEYKWMSRRFYLNVVYKFGKVESSKAKVTQESGGGGDF